MKCLGRVDYHLEVFRFWASLSYNLEDRLSGKKQNNCGFSRQMHKFWIAVNFKFDILFFAVNIIYEINGAQLIDGLPFSIFV